jgi:outer membrane protein insertion porin family
VGQTIAEVRVEQEGRIVSDPNVLALIETTAGEPLSMRDVTETATQLMSLGRFEDVQAAVDALPGGVRVRFLLLPLHPVDRVEFRGPLGVAESELRELVRDRFGRAPAAARQAEIADVIKAHYRRRGFPAARVAPRIEETHNPDRATLILDLDAGPRALVETVQLIQVDQQEQGVLPLVPTVRQGRPYDEADITSAIDDWIGAMHARGFYEARASFGVAFPGSAAHVQLTLTRGPAVTIAFAGDPLSDSERERLVPVRAEGSADQDLLEDSSRRIEDYLYDLGYRDARASYAPVEKDGELTITFTVRRGPRYLLDSLVVTGAAAIPEAEVREALQLEEDAPFVQLALTAGVARVQALYRSRGYIRAEIKPGTSVRPPARAEAPDRHIEATIAIVEGPRTLVRSVTFQGNTSVAEASLNAVIVSAPGRVFSEGDVANDREVIDFEYRNRGFESVVVSVQTMLSGSNTDANIVFTVSEGPQTFVDDLIIIGNDRTSRRTIEREMVLRPGEPLGYSALIESRSRVMALGLFSSVQIEPQGQASAARRDVLVRVEESDANTIGGGGGLEGTVLLRPTGVEGSAEERLDIAPHGFLELGRRNLWGKNRAVTLFTRVSFRSRDRLDSDGTLTSSQGFHEYRVQTTFREPRIFDSAADALFTASSEQALRSSFNFSRRLVRGEAGLRLSPAYSVSGRYSFEQTKLFDDDSVPVNDRPLIDRLFSEVRLSKLAGSLIRDTRDDIVNATSGRLFILDGNLAARAMGSEVGFVSTYLQGFTFHRLPVRREIIAAIGGRLGVAHGFPRTVGDQIVQDLPASERFFAGGETTVRGFALDRLGNAATTTATGFPTGGNSVVVLNAELRVGVTGRLQAVGFLDAGNVFPRARDLSLTDLRATPGVGGRFNAGLALIRVDVGFNVDRREILPGTRERGYVLHISLGQAF